MRKLINLMRPRRRRLEQGLERELRYHLDRRVTGLMMAGLNESEARRQAMIELGGIAQVQEEVRDTWWWRWLRDLGRDLRYSARTLLSSPGFTITAVLSLALGIGANTAVFTLIDAVLLKSLPVRHPQELVLLRWVVPEGRFPLGQPWGNSWEEHGRRVGTSFYYRTYQKIRNQATGRGRPLSTAIAFTDIRDYNVLINGEAALAAAHLVSSDYFQALGIQPAVGRTFFESDDQLAAPQVCVISDRYWKKRFGGDPSAVGKTIVVNGAPATIIGVTPPEFFGVQPGKAFDLALPLSAEPVVMHLDPQISPFSPEDPYWVLIMGRLNVHGSKRQARAVLDGIFKQAAGEFELPPKARAPVTLASLELEPGGLGISDLRRDFSRPLLILMAMVGLVLLIACVNVANLLLSRAAARQREIGIRLSIGASRGRLIRQLLTESVLLACMGGAVGCAMAWWGSRLLVTMMSRSGNPILLNLNPDLRLLGFTGATCLITGLLFGLAPAFRATRADVTPTLKGNTPVGLRHGGRPVSLAQTLIIAQAALSVVLMFGAALFVRTLGNLHNVNTGFAHSLLLFGVDAYSAGYKGRALNDFYSRVQERVAALPGVVSATASFHLLLSGAWRRDGITVAGYNPQPGERMKVYVMPAGPEFFKTMEIPLLLGRDFTKRDNEDAPKAAVVNDTFVKRYFGNRNPIGQRIGFGENPFDMEIVGVAADAKYASLRDGTPATVYQPFRQANLIRGMHFELRTAGNPKSLIRDVRQVVASLDRNVPLYDVKTQDEQIGELLLQERLFAKLSAFFGLLSLALVCVGLFGVLAYAVARRTREIGIRMALGAKREAIVSMVLKETMFVVGAGLLLGISASFAAARFAASVISDLLYGIEPNDAISLLAATAALVAAAAFASFVPARRASRVDPMTAIRHE